MQTELIDLQPQLIQASKNVDDIMVIIERDSIEVAKVEKVIHNPVFVSQNRIVTKFQPHVKIYHFWHFDDTFLTIFDH